MQKSVLRSYEPMVNHSGENIKTSDVPLSPASVVVMDANAAAVDVIVNKNDPLITDVSNNVGCSCACFRFWDFFKEDEREDTFASIALDEIKPVSADEQYSNEQRKKTRNRRSRVVGREDYMYNDTSIDKEGVSSTATQNHMAIDSLIKNHDSENSTANERQHPEEEEYADDDFLITLSFSPSTFSEGDDISYRDSDVDNNNTTNKSCEEFRVDSEEEYKIIHSSEDRSIDDGSSSLSFDSNDFNEDDFEDDFYGSVEKSSSFSLEAKPTTERRNHLPTIEENVENSFSCDVGGNFRSMITHVVNHQYESSPPQCSECERDWIP